MTNRQGQCQSDYWCPLSRPGFPTQLKCNKVGIDKEKTLRVIIREKLSKRAVMKEMGSDGCIFKRGD